MASVIGDMTFDFRIPDVFATSVAEIDGARDPAAHSLHPEIHAWEVGRNTVARHDHLGGKRFVVAVTPPIEVSLKYDGVVVGHGRLLGGRRGALERRAAEQFRRVPAGAVVFEARSGIIWIDA